MNVCYTCSYNCSVTQQSMKTEEVRVVMRDWGNKIEEKEEIRYICHAPFQCKGVDHLLIVRDERESDLRQEDSGSS